MRPLLSRSKEDIATTGHRLTEAFRESICTQKVWMISDRAPSKRMSTGDVDEEICVLELCEERVRRALLPSFKRLGLLNIIMKVPPTFIRAGRLAACLSNRDRNSGGDMQCEQQRTSSVE